MLLGFGAVYTRLRNALPLFVTTFLNSLSWVAGTLGKCLTLNVKCSLYTHCLNPLSLVGGTVWEDCGISMSGTLMETVACYGYCSV